MSSPAFAPETARIGAPQSADAASRPGFAPLATLPADASPALRRQAERLARQAGRSYRAAVTLKCYECCAWYRAEARRCPITGCPLWAVSSRIFRRPRACGAVPGLPGEGSA